LITDYPRGATGSPNLERFLRRPKSAAEDLRPAGFSLLGASGLKVFAQRTWEAAMAKNDPIILQANFIDWKQRAEDFGATDPWLYYCPEQFLKPYALDDEETSSAFASRVIEAFESDTCGKGPERATCRRCRLRCVIAYRQAPRDCNNARNPHRG
jgi:hypothetical protein